MVKLKLDLQTSNILRLSLRRRFCHTGSMWTGLHLIIFSFFFFILYSLFKMYGLIISILISIHFFLLINVVPPSPVLLPSTRKSGSLYSKRFTPSFGKEEISLRLCFPKVEIGGYSRLEINRYLLDKCTISPSR